MAYDPYKSLLANARRDHLRHNADLNTHLVGNVFLPAIASQRKENLSAPIASLKHLKVIEQCIMAENKREGRLAKCSTIRERRIMTKKFQTQRERERRLIQTLMLGDYPDRQHEIKLFEKEATTPRQHLNAEITGISARVATPDRVFRKADVTGGLPKTKPHAHKAFKLPECNGSPGKRYNAGEQDAASIKLSSPSRPTSRGTQSVTNGKKRSSSLSAKENSVRYPNSKVKTPSENMAAGSSQRMQSPYMSLHRHQTRSAKATAQFSSLSNKPTEQDSLIKLVNADASVEDQQKETSVSFEGALSFSEAQQFAEAMGSDAQLRKEKCEKILTEFGTQTTSRLLQDVLQENEVTRISSRPELPLIDTSLVTGLTAATTPRRPQSVRAQQSTRQSFLESLARDNQILRERRETTAQLADGKPETDSQHEEQNMVEEELKSQAIKQKDLVVGIKDASAGEDHSLIEEEDKSQARKDEEPGTDTKYTLDSADIGSANEDHSHVEDDEKDNFQASTADGPAVETKEALDSAGGTKVDQSVVEEDNEEKFRSSKDEEPVIGIKDVFDSADIGRAKEDHNLVKDDAKDNSQASAVDEPAVQIKDALSSADVGGEEVDQILVVEDKEETCQARKDEEPVLDIKDALDSADVGSGEDYGDDFVEQDEEEDDELETDVAKTLFDLVDMVEAAATAKEKKQKIIIPSPRTVSPRPRSSTNRANTPALRIQSVFRGYRARIAFRLALYEDALSCGVLGAMPGTIQGRSGWYLDPKRLIAYFFVIPDPDGEWEQKYTLRCSRLVLTPYEMQQEVLSKVPADLQQS
ncbi:hypothetical protein L914_05885 [Phytophthora nicotianae]|uniref:Uncharacterized protein n=1 Tax=Phytophthora nicotianae TaxID=4792 RepID=W2NN30_PHYNI|nr:hypothetical protein L914_05885 [Phytophthora nicotianae]